MSRRTRSPSSEISRRGFLGAATVAVGGLFIGPARASPADEHLLAGDPARLTPFEREHLPVLHAPEFTINKAKVPLVVEMAHPMTADHYIEAIEVTDGADRVPGKGVFYLTPANGRVHLAFQARVDPGKSELTVAAVCNRHGRWSCRRSIEVDEGGSGCSGNDPAVGRSASEEVHPPAIRIAELVKDGRLRRGQVVHAQVKIRHPNRRGRAIREGKIDLESKPLYLEQMEVEYAGERVCKFALTAALSDDPFLTFALCPKREGTLKVVFSNNRGQKLEAVHQVRFS
jgi:desulfoferrodoxin (superoxide reductase-like protein)